MKATSALIRKEKLTGLENVGSKVKCTFKGAFKPELYDVVVGADGAESHVRYSLICFVHLM